MRAKLILFDLGGVLASLGRPSEQMELSISERDFWSLWLNSNTVAELETGVIEETEFYERFPSELNLDLSHEDFRRRFMQWRLELFPDVVDMLRELGQAHDIALLSNTNSIHWNMVDPDGNFRQLFDHVFLSFEIGHAKPQRQVFEYVLNAIGYGIQVFEYVLNAVPDDPGDIVFLDDTDTNVEAASGLGIRSVQVTGPEGARRALALRV